MEAAPPNYETATAPQKWNLIASYLPSNDLCSAVLVCEEWHRIFAPHLWGNPASHFGSENDRVYVALTKFKRTLPWARQSVRSLTHTLHLPPAHAEIYYGPHTDWLREVLLRLPNLQSLIVRGLPFFDHACLNALKYLQPTGGNDSRYAQAFGLRLLDASRCANVTATGLYQALNRFPFMLYLDLSFTFPARDHAVLKSLQYMTGLQVLKLRGISLRDEDVEVLASAISTRVKALDMRNNQLTDRSIRALLQYCLPPITGFDTSTFSAYADRTPSLLSYLGAEMLAIYRGEQYESYIRKAFTAGFVNRLAIEDTPESGTGITHLSISDNQITVEGASELLLSGRLHLLDIGTIKTDFSSSLEDPDDMNLPGAEQLIPDLVEAGGQNLTFLRIDHCLVTREAAIGNDDTEVVPGYAELPDMSQRPVPQGLVELPDTSISELPTESGDRYELPEDCVHVKITSATSKPSRTHEEQGFEFIEARRGSTTAPEVIESSQDRFNIAKGRRGSEAAPETFEPSKDPPGYSLHPLSAFENGSATESQVNLADYTASVGRLSGSIRTSRPRTYSSVISERASRVKTHLAKSKIHPGVLPSLKTLVLTDVPPFSPNPNTAGRLVDYIHDCADEARLAQIQAQLDYSVPPGRKFDKASSDVRAHSLFPLQEIVLEMARNRPIRTKGSGSSWRHHGTKSVTQDYDSEALASAADTDFSFFGEYDDAIPSLEPASNVNFPGMHGIEVGTAPQITPALGKSKDRRGSLPQIDVINKISEFRKATKAAYQSQIACGEINPHVQGYWDGNIKVIRPSLIVNPMDEDDEVLADYYGNVCSHSGIYR